MIALSRGGRPLIEMELRALVRQMSTENQLWVRHVSTANCSSLGLASLNQPSPSTWSSDVDLPVRGGRPFLRNHAPDIAAMDLFVVPTVGFRLLYGFVIVRLHRRVSYGSTSQPTRQRSGLHARSPRHFLGTLLRVI
jgi:hypothetical protein